NAGIVTPSGLVYATVFVDTASGCLVGTCISLITFRSGSVNPPGHRASNPSGIGIGDGTASWKYWRSALHRQMGSIGEAGGFTPSAGKASAAGPGGIDGVANLRPPDWP